MNQKKWVNSKYKLQIMYTQNRTTMSNLLRHFHCVHYFKSHRKTAPGEPIDTRTGKQLQESPSTHAQENSSRRAHRHTHRKTAPGEPIDTRTGKQLQESPSTHAQENSSRRAHRHTTGKQLQESPSTHTQENSSGRAHRHTHRKTAPGEPIDTHTGKQLQESPSTHTQENSSRRAHWHEANVLLSTHSRLHCKVVLLQLTNMQLVPHEKAEWNYALNIDHE